ncbi:hypothetical protein K1719_025625 [Acacia pycnantha]|nr:hypothetical protein K1719_025625 [Acacia pycnantha]
MPAKKKKMPREMKETRLVLEASTREAPTKLVVEPRVSMAAEAPLKNHKPHGRGSQPRRRNQGGKLKILFIPKSELDSSNSELDHTLDELSICEDFDVERESELKNEVENLERESERES